jgi:hypothetical protein
VIEAPKALGSLDSGIANSNLAWCKCVFLRKQMPYEKLDLHLRGPTTTTVNRIRKEYYLLGYNTVQSVESQPTFRRKPSKITVWKLQACFRSGILFSLFDPEDGGDMFQWNVSWLSTEYMALHPRRIFITTAVRTSNPKIHKYWEGQTPELGRGGKKLHTDPCDLTR